MTEGRHDFPKIVLTLRAKAVEVHDDSPRFGYRGLVA